MNTHLSVPVLGLARRPFMSITTVAIKSNAVRIVARIDLAYGAGTNILTAQKTHHAD